jgi:hypothetical protein
MCAIGSQKKYWQKYSPSLARPRSALTGTHESPVFTSMHVCRRRYTVVAATPAMWSSLGSIQSPWKGDKTMKKRALVVDDRAFYIMTECPLLKGVPELRSLKLQ